MGACSNALIFYIRVFKKRKPQGKLLTYGVKSIQGNYEDLVKLFEQEDYDYVKLKPEERCIENRIKEFGNNSVHSDVFFKMLGFSEIDSIDYFPNENPTYILDLNNPIPDKMHGKYDFVLDGGTMEHCFNVKEVMHNCIRALKIGGCVIHGNPLSGWINHGFYQFSPTLYYDFYSINGFKDMDMDWLVDYNYTLEYNLKYMPKDFLGLYSVLAFSAVKEKEVELKYPIQSDYEKWFGKKQAGYTLKSNVQTNKVILKELFSKSTFEHFVLFFKEYIKFLRYRQKI